MKLEEKTINQKYPFNGNVFKVRVDEAMLPNGNMASREIIEHSGGVGIVAITDKHEVLLVKQWRYPFSKVLLEIPAGKLNPNELPISCAYRELKEETGAYPNTMTYIGNMYPTPGYSNEVIHLFLATNLIMNEQELDQDEFLELVIIPLETALNMVETNEIVDAKTIIGLLQAKNQIKNK